MVHQQIKSILNLFHQINQSSNQQYLQNILTNQRYLHTILNDKDIDEPIISPVTFTIDGAENDKTDIDYEIGLQYLATYLAQPKHLPHALIQDIGKFSYFASITQLAVQHQLGHALAKLNLSADLQLEAVQHILQQQIPQLFTHHALTDIELEHLQTSLHQLLDLLKQMLLTLDKPLPLADKLAFLQNLHDDVATGFNLNNFIKQ